MTTSKVDERRRKRAAPPKVAKNIIEDLGNHLRLAIEASTGRKIQFEKYCLDPVGFCVDVLGETLWSRQNEILEAVRDHTHVSVRSGHKIGKSRTAVLLALWFYSCFDDARVIFSSTTSRQVDAVLWRELSKVLSTSKTKIPGEFFKLARSGFKSEDFREIVGFTSKEAEGMAGISGTNILYLIDEASGVPDEIFETIEGNRGGGVNTRIVLFSNPTRTVGEFFRSHRDPKSIYRAIHVSSEETPNVVENRIVIVGLAHRPWIEQMREKYGEDSAWYKVRVLGQFVENEEGRVVSLHAITVAEGRFDETPYTGRLHVGVDCAGDSGTGDESAFAARRGFKVRDIIARRGLTADGHVAMVLGIIKEEKKLCPEDNETPFVVVDRDGTVGARVFAAFISHVNTRGNERDFTLIGVRSGEWAKRAPKLYVRVRDELHGSLEAWLKEGGAIPVDTNLEQDLHAAEWHADARNRSHVQNKDEIKAHLGRSPDKGDAVMLAVWVPSDHEAHIKAQITTRQHHERKQEVARAPVFDSYAGLDAWDPRRQR